MNDKDYWSELGLNEAWSKKERFNYLMGKIEETVVVLNNTLKIIRFKLMVQPVTVEKKIIKNNF